MKQVFPLIATFLMTAGSSFSQPAAQKQAEQKKMTQADSIATKKLVIANKNIISAGAATNNTAPKTEISSAAIRQNLVKGDPEKSKPGTTGNSNATTTANRGNASLLDVFAYAYTGFNNDLGAGKDGNTHWSFGLFDQNDKPIASFHDDSDNDAYEPLTGALVKMHIDNPPKFSDFANGGHIHVNIAPVGHDTWDFDNLALTFDFTNPAFTLKINLQPGILSQDHRDVDLYFKYDGQNFVLR